MTSQQPYPGISSVLPTDRCDNGSIEFASLRLSPTRLSAVPEGRTYARPSAPRPDLAPREREVLIAWLLTDNKNLVARQLHVSPATVRTHLQRIRAKYADVGRPARTKAALVARAVQDGLIGIDDL